MGTSKGLRVTVELSAPEALASLQRAYAQRHAAADSLARTGQRVVGLSSTAVPEELVLAAGCVPVIAAPSLGHAAPLADRYLEPRAPRDQRALFEAALRGDYAMLELFVLTREHEQLYYYLKEMVRRGDGPRVPPLWIFDLLASQRPTVERYNRQQTRALLERLERLAGAPIDPATLRDITAAMNEKRALLRTLQERRVAGAVTGVEALQVIGAGFLLPLEQYRRLLATYLAALPSSGARAKPRLLVLPAAPLSSTALHERLEHAGAVVVAEDDWWGARAASDDVSLDGDPLEALMQHAWQTALPHLQFPRAARQAWFRAQAASAWVDGVVFYVPPDDQQFGWDYPALKAWLDERGTPSMLVRADVEEPGGAEQVTAQAAAFVGVLERAGAARAGATA